MARGGIRAGKAYVELYADDSRLTRGLKVATNKVNAFGDRMMGISASLAKMSGIILTPAVLGVREFAKFEEQMARVSTMVDDTTRYMGKFTNAVSDMAVKFGQGTATLSQGLYDILSAQVDASKALGVLREGAKNAIGGFTQTKQSVSALVTILEAYGGELKNAADASDLLFSIVKRGRLTFGELAANLGKVAPTAAAVGVSVEEFGAALSLITRGMPETEKATTALANVIETFMKNTDEGKEAAKKLGIEMSAAGLESQGLLYVIKQLSKVSPDKVAEVFPRRRALRGLIIAVQKSEELQEDIDAMVNRGGAAQEAYEKMAKTLMRSFKRVWQAVREVGRAIGVSFGDETKAVTDIITSALRAISEFLRENQNLTKSIISVGVALAAGAGLFLSIGLAAKIAAISMAGLMSVFGLFTSVIGSVALLATPMGLIITSLVAMGVALYKTRNLWMDFASTATDSVGEVASIVVDKFTRMWEIAWSATREYFGAIVNYIKAGQLENAFEVAVLGIQLLWTEVTQGMRNAWAILVASVAANMDWLKSFLSSGWAGFEKIFLDLVDSLKIAWYKFSDIIVSAVMGPLQKVYDFLNKMMQAMPDFLMPDYMKNMFDVDLGDWTNNVDKIIKDIEDVKAAREEAFEGKFGELPDIEQLAGEYANAMVSGNEDALNELRRKYREAIKEAHSEGVKDAIEQGKVDPKDNGIGGDLGLGGGGVEREAAGFFSPFAAGRSPAVAVQQEIASNTKQTNQRLDETNRNLTKMNRKMDGSGNAGMEIT